MRARSMPVLALVVIAAACGGDSAGADECADPVPVTSVDILGTAPGFEPDCLLVDTGASITLRNTDHMPHSFTVDGTEVNYRLGGGDSAEADLSGLEPGLFYVSCVFHPSMEATLRVE